MMRHTLGVRKFWPTKDCILVDFCTFWRYAVGQQAVKLLSKSELWKTTKKSYSLTNPSIWI